MIDQSLADLSASSRQALVGSSAGKRQRLDRWKPNCARESLGVRRRGQLLTEMKMKWHGRFLTFLFLPCFSFGHLAVGAFESIDRSFWSGPDSIDRLVDRSGLMMGSSLFVLSPRI